MSEAGAAYLIYGSALLEGNDVDTNVGTPQLPGVRIVGADARIQFGDSAVGNADFDGDGKRDFVVTSAYRKKSPVADLIGELSHLFFFFGGERIGSELMIS